MSEDRQVSSEVEVAVDAGTAFRAFTEEMNLWWVRGLSTSATRPEPPR
jgi:hypothetical protein